MKLSKLKVTPKPSTAERAASASRGLTVRSELRGGIGEYHARGSFSGPPLYDVPV
ncbi:MAG: hypothetical protein H6741_12755 [Alphaproteobacteria bacterium]|nr:hypothetical protein [Alphaproteobacteria bacterium]